jgi:putative component of toxin-antitoxin plasmid stabilization module
MRVEKTEAYREWIDALKDRAGRARILVRVERLIGGNPGQHRDIAKAIELAKHFEE